MGIGRLCSGIGGLRTTNMHTCDVIKLAYVIKKGLGRRRTPVGDIYVFLETVTIYPNRILLSGK